HVTIGSRSNPIPGKYPRGNRRPAGNDVTRRGRYVPAGHTHRAHSTHPPRAVGRDTDRGLPRPVLLLPLVRTISRPLTRLPDASSRRFSAGCRNAVRTG